MTGRLLMLIALLALTTAAVGCDDAGPGLTFDSAPWSDGDELVYDWVDKAGNRLGSAEFRFVRVDNAWVQFKAVRLTEVVDEAEIRIDEQTLRPLSSHKTIKAPGTDATVTSTYRDGKLHIQAAVNGEDRSASIDVADSALDNDQILMTLRAVPFSDDYVGRYVNVVSQNAAKLTTTVRVLQQEDVSVPAGSFQAWKVELDFGQVKHLAWYQIDYPHHLVKYDNGTLEMVLASANGAASSR